MVNRALKGESHFEVMLQDQAADFLDPRDVVGKILILEEGHFEPGAVKLQDFLKDVFRTPHPVPPLGKEFRTKSAVVGTASGGGHIGGEGDFGNGEAPELVEVAIIIK